MTKILVAAFVLWLGSVDARADDIPPTFYSVATIYSRGDDAIDQATVRGSGGDAPIGVPKAFGEYRCHILPTMTHPKDQVLYRIVECEAMSVSVRIMVDCDATPATLQLKKKHSYFTISLGCKTSGL